MSDAAKPLNTEAIEALLASTTPDQVATTGIIADMKKGMAEGFASITALLKGKMSEKKPEPENDEDDAPNAGAGGDGGSEGGEGAGAAGGEGEGKPAEGEKKPEADDEEDNKGPGYNDMRLGENGDLQIDATEYLLGLEKKVNDLTKANKALRKAVRDSRIEASANQQEMREAIAALANAMAPMAKAILQTNVSMLDIPQAVHDPGKVARNQAARDAINRIPADPKIDIVILAKGLRTEIITEAQKQHFQATGQFVPDEAEHKAIVARLLK